MSRILILASALALAVALLPIPAGAASATIQPGDMIVIGQSAVCTLNFVFDGAGSLAGKVFFGTAAHCIAGKRNASIDHQWGFNAAGTSNGGYLLASTDFARFAKVSYLGDYGDSVNGGKGVENGVPGTQHDFALLEVQPAYLSKVAPSVRGHPASPSGYTLSSQTRQGDLLWHSGHGTIYSDVQAIRENHAGILYSDNPATYVEVGSSVPGDSGGPILHAASGKALGIVSSSSVGIGLPPVRDVGPTVEGVLAELASLGIHVTLRTV